MANRFSRYGREDEPQGQRGRQDREIRDDRPDFSRGETEWNRNQGVQGRWRQDQRFETHAYRPERDDDRDMQNRNYTRDNETTGYRDNPREWGGERDRGDWRDQGSWRERAQQEWQEFRHGREHDRGPERWVARTTDERDRDRESWNQPRADWQNRDWNRESQNRDWNRGQNRDWDRERNVGREQEGYSLRDYFDTRRGEKNRGGAQREETLTERVGRFFGVGPKGYRRSDERIREDVSESLEDHPEIDASELEVTVKDGDVTLTGTVDNRLAKRLAEDVAANCRGVKDVNNQIRVAERDISQKETSRRNRAA
ncbi:MAG TPA: BON domain-containing protein [Terriglobales bacterium]|nr:BON domain-containing protein [Terriglobales bacterium]